MELISGDIVNNTNIQWQTHNTKLNEELYGSTAYNCNKKLVYKILLKSFATTGWMF